MVSERIQWIIVVLLALILLITAVLCYKKDDYLYDPQFQGDDMPPSNTYIKKYFKDTGADVQHSIYGRRALAACESCVNNRITPNACDLCSSYIKGHDLIKPGV
jgi:hypothetical protein